MKYFNGFSLKKEERLFTDWFDDSFSTVVGFSYGAQQALEYVLKTTQRVDRLILLSPAFFQTQSPSFVRAQLRYFETDREKYVAQFLKNVSYPSTQCLDSYLHVGTKEELEALLTYQWEACKLERILQRGVTVEVVMGEKDKIVNVQEAKAFFTQTTNYFLQEAGHLLRSQND